MLGVTMKGLFKPKNPQKYKGDTTNIIYRSSYELKMMMELDSNKNVVLWGSETIIIPYRSPVDNKIHRYFVDFIVTEINKEGKKITRLIEVKPLKQTLEPKKPSKVTKKYINEAITYSVNKAKWNAAESFCKDRKWLFEIYTEKHLKIPEWKKK
jgi:hypothetical protein